MVTKVTVKYQGYEFLVSGNYSKEDQGFEPDKVFIVGTHSSIDVTDFIEDAYRKASQVPLDSVMLIKIVYRSMWDEIIELAIEACLENERYSKEVKAAKCLGSDEYL